MKRKILKSIVAGSAALLALCVVSSAQEYPTRPIRVIVGLAPGGGGDIFARTMSEGLRKAWGVPVVVENRPGGGETIGARACAESAPDGYSVCFLSNEATTYHQFLFKNNPFDGAKELQPVTGIFINTFGLAVSGSLKLKTLDELVARSKASPGTFSYGTFSFPLTRFMENLNRDTGSRHSTGAVPRRQRLGQCNAVRIDPGRSIRTVEHAASNSCWPTVVARSKQQNALTDVSRRPNVR